MLHTLLSTHYEFNPNGLNKIVVSCASFITHIPWTNRLISITILSLKTPKTILFGLPLTHRSYEIIDSESKTHTYKAIFQLQSVCFFYFFPRAASCCLITMSARDSITLEEHEEYCYPDWSSLPDVLIIHIFTFLDAKSLCRVSIQLFNYPKVLSFKCCIVGNCFILKLATSNLSPEVLRTTLCH